MEKLLYERLYQFLNQNKCLHNDKFVFRNHYSTNHTLITRTERLRNALDDGKYVCCAFLDLQTTFDIVNHKILLFKLEHYRVRRTPFKFFQNYLMNRTQFVEINKESSNKLWNSPKISSSSTCIPYLYQ